MRINYKIIKDVSNNARVAEVCTDFCKETRPEIRPNIADRRSTPIHRAEKKENFTFS